jgi:uncharacterized delta-60 repeat protein
MTKTYRKIKGESSMGLLRLFGLTAALSMATLTYAAPADLDSSFGMGGIVAVPEIRSPFISISSHPAAMQSDGKLLLAVGVQQPTAGATNALKVSWQIRRYTVEGGPDDSFGVAGSVTVSFDLPFSGGYLGDDYPKAIALLPDGRFVVAGQSLGQSSQCSFGCESNFLMARFNADGRLDSSFGNNGKVVSASVLGADSLARQSDGKLVVVGNQNIGRAQIWTLELHRFNVDGSRDTSFAAAIACAGNGTFRLTPDDKMVIVASIPAAYADPANHPGFCVARLNADGSPDRTFATQGKTTVKAGINVSLGDVVVDAAGAITVFGKSTVGMLFRLTANGHLDTTFGQAGVVENSVVRSFASGMVDCANRTLVAAAGLNSGSFSTARFLSNGALDIMFSGTESGFAKTYTDTDNVPTPRQVLLRANGRFIVLASDYGLKRLNIVQHQGDTVCSRTHASTVVEFYNAQLDNYFVTADANEAAGIDQGSAGPGWSRTGETFKSGGTTAVCRFYGSLSPGPNSHFYTLAGPECDSLKRLQAETPNTEPRWNFESLDFVSTPPIDGICPTDSVPVYRAYNDGYARGGASNHRISTRASAILALVTRGWRDEGVLMCAPQ